MNKEDFDNFQASFQHIDDILKVLVDELDKQFKYEHMMYDVEWDKDIFNAEALKDKKLRFHVIKLFIHDALMMSSYNALGLNDFKGQDPWFRINGIMALRQSKEDVQSPISAEEYEEIKVTAEKAKALDLESVHVNNERPEWTQEQQEALIMKKEEDVIA